MRRLVVVTALMAEAVPLVDFYRMQKIEKLSGYHHYRRHAGDNHLQLDLLVCGIGAERTRRGVATYLERVRPMPVTRWLNLGIAGGFEFETGRLVWGSDINRQPIGLPAGVQLADTARVVSLAQEGREYRKGVLFDMEAESFMQTLGEKWPEFAPKHLFCAKVISDNPARDPVLINKRWVTDIIRKQIKPLDSFIQNIISTVE